MFLKLALADYLYFPQEVSDSIHQAPVVSWSLNNRVLSIFNPQSIIRVSACIRQRMNQLPRTGLRKGLPIQPS